MRPILFVIPGWDIKVHSYGVMIFVACFAALAIGRLARAAREDRPQRRLRAGDLALPGRRDRCAGRLRHPAPESIHSLGDIFRSWQGGNVFYGCILGGLTGSILYWFRRPFPFWAMADVAAPAVAIGAARRPDRLLLERLLRRGGLRPALGRPVPGRLACLGAPGRTPA